MFYEDFKRIFNWLFGRDKKLVITLMDSKISQLFEWLTYIFYWNVL